MENVELECDICRELCYKPTSIQCCQTKACRLCALTYVLKNRACWDCGAQISQAELRENTLLEKKLETLFPPPVTQPLHCDLCNSIVQKGVRTSCCSRQACRSCARKFILVNRVCWTSTCLDEDVWISILETDLHLRAAVQLFQSRGRMDDEVAQQLRHRESEASTPPPRLSPFAEDERVPVTTAPFSPSDLPSDQYNSNESTVESNPPSVHSTDTQRESGPASRGHRLLKRKQRKRHLDSHRSKIGSNKSEEDVDSNLRDMTISPDVMDLDSEEEITNTNENSQDEVYIINGSEGNEDEGKDDIREVEEDAIEEGGEDDKEDSVEEIKDESETSQDGSTRSKNGNAPGAEWVFKNGEGWALKPSQETSKPGGAGSSTWVKDENGWSVRVDHEAAEKSGKRNMDPTAAPRADKHKRLKKDSEAASEPVCVTIGRSTLYTNSDNYVLLRVNSAPASVQSVWVKYTSELIALLAPFNLGRLSQKCRVLRKDENAFIILNLQLKGEKGVSSPVHVKRGFSVGLYTVLKESAETADPVVDITMDFCVDYSIGEIQLGREPQAVKIFLKFQKPENISKRSILEQLFLVSLCCNSRIQILSHIFRPDPCKYLAPQNVVSNDMTADIIMKSKDGEKVVLRGKEYIGEVRACDNDAAVTSILNTFGLVISEHMHDIISVNSDDSDLEIVDSIGGKENKTDNAPEENVFDLDPETRSKLSESKKEEGNSLFAKACYSLASKKYSEAILLCPDNAQLYANRAACYVALQNGEKGLEDAEKSIELDPQYAKAYFRGAKAAILMGELEKAQEYYDKVSELDPEGVAVDELKNLRSLHRMNSELTEFLDSKDYTRALDTIKDLVYLCPGCVELNITKAEILALMGTFEESNRIINDIKGFNANPQCLYVKALCLYYKDNADLSTHFLKEVFVLDPEHKKAKDIQDKIDRWKEMKEEAFNRVSEEKFEEAMSIYDNALQVDPSNKYMNSKIYQLKGSVLAKEGKHILAIEEFNKSIEMDRIYSKSYYSRARSYIELELFEDALRDAEQTIRLESGSNIYRQFYNETKAKLDESKNKDFYKLLGVGKKSGQDEIKKAYRKAALIHHPDRHSTTPDQIKTFHEKRFKEIGEAYGVLSDESKRLLYDKGLLYKSIQAQTPAQYTNVNISNMAMRNAALWATLAQQQHQQAQAANSMRHGGIPAAARRSAGLAGAQPGAGLGGPGLAGASPFLFVPGAVPGAGAQRFSNFQNLNLGNFQQFQRFSQFGYQNPYRKY